MNQGEAIIYCRIVGSTMIVGLYNGISEILLRAGNVVCGYEIAATPIQIQLPWIDLKICAYG